MASSDFEREKTEFREFYTTSQALLDDAKNAYVALINAVVARPGILQISKVEGRIKDREECIRKFNRKYRTELEREGSEYKIKDHISDLIGLRIVCLYEDNIEAIKEVLSEHFTILEVTDKISAIENTESSFGYKGLHIDMKLGPSRCELPEYRDYAHLQFELQIRTIVQDSWSVLDHKIKYKKAIPNNLKRRINTLAALFELADREFRQIRDSTEEEIRKAESDPTEEEIRKAESDPTESSIPSPAAGSTRLSNGSFPLDAFGLLRIARHFFPHHEFEAHKVDGFTAEIVELDPNATRRDLNAHIRDTIAKVKRYQTQFEQDNPDDKLNPYTIVRHCLYLSDNTKFHSLLNNKARDSFDDWLRRNEG